jgi:hypothetical protein
MIMIKVIPSEMMPTTALFLKTLITLEKDRNIRPLMMIAKMKIIINAISAL